MQKILGYTTGVFDLFHIGHLNILKQAKSMCDMLYVGVMSDEAVYMRKGQNPIIPYEARREIVANISCVDGVIKQDIDCIKDLPGYMINMHDQLKFQKLFKGSDVVGSDIWKKIEKELKPLGVDVVFIPYTEGISSTLIKKKIREYAE